MKLVLDTNILIAALIKDSITREILLHPEMEYLIPEFALQEIEKHVEIILRKSRLSSEKFVLLLEQMKLGLTVIPASDITHREEASRIMHNIDSEDAAFIALALSIRNDGIWSEDKHFEKQNNVKIWKTKDVIEHLGIKHT